MEPSIMRIWITETISMPIKFFQWRHYSQNQGSELRPFKQFRGKCKGVENGVPKIKAISEKRERKRNSEERQARFANAEWLTLKGDSGQRRMGWGKEENKAACFECGNTDRSKAQCPFWKSKKESAQ